MTISIFARCTCGLLSLLLVTTSAMADVSTLATARSRGFLSCGISEGHEGFSAPDAQGKWTGLDVDYCRAVAAAVFSDADKVKFRPLAASEGLTALRKGEIDVLARATPWSISLGVDSGVQFVGVSYFDGQGLMVRRTMGVTSVLELSGATICAPSSTELRQGITDYFKSKKMPFEILAFDRNSDAVTAYSDKRCDAITDLQSNLSSMRSQLAAPDDHVVLPDTIAKSPLGPLVRRDDTQWLTIAQWTLYAMIAAEEMDITSRNAERLASTDNVRAKRLFGTEADLGQQVGLGPTWGLDIVRLVGNYGEVFERNLGAGSRIDLPRSFNNLWNNGGLIYSPLFR